MGQAAGSDGAANGGSLCYYPPSPRAPGPGNPAPEHGNTTMAGKAKTREKLVETLFHGTGTTYDEMVHFATWGRDRQWKRELLDLMEQPKRVLDLASGTGILSRAIAKRYDCHVTGVELRPEYAEEAERVGKEQGLDTRFIVSPAEHFYIDEKFDHITSCYLPKYVSEVDALINNLVKMLAPGGLLLLQDFAYPDKPMWQTLYHNHFKRMQRLAREEAPGWLTMFEGLPEVIRTSSWKRDYIAAMKDEGLLEVRIVEQSFGLSALAVGRQPAA
jgi:demethylmenaquinone methyltransferase / 2-methoxy-6-polyprenyl-1,4-benzoquinol methylase